MFHTFFSSLARSKYFSFFSHSFSFIMWSAGIEKSTVLQVLSFFIIIRSGLLAEIRWSVCMSKSHRSLRVSFFRTDAGLCIYHLLVWSLLLLLLLLFNFHLYFPFLTGVHRVFTQDLGWGKVMIIFILYIYDFTASFEWYFSVTLIVL